MSELAEWQAYDSVDPIGSYRSDLNFALLAYLTAGDKDSKISDFLLIDPHPMTDEEKEQLEQQRHEIKSREEVEKMIAMFKEVEE